MKHKVLYEWPGFCVSEEELFVVTRPPLHWPGPENDPDLG